MNPVRLWGDPFAGTAAAARLRAFLILAGENGCEVALALGAVREAAVTGGEVVELTDGARVLRVGTALCEAELARLRRAVTSVVPGSAPVVVFAEAEGMADGLALAGLEWPRACKVIPAQAAATAQELLARVRAELRWAGTEDPPVCRERAELQPFLALPPVDPQGVLVHVGAVDGSRGTDLVLRLFAREVAAGGRRLRVVLDGEAAERDAFVAAAGELLRQEAPPGIEPAVEFVPGPLRAAHLRDAAVVLLPWRQAAGLEVVVDALASGRPVLLSRWGGTAGMVPGPGLCEPIGGRLLPAENGQPGRFEPQVRALSAALRAVLADPARAAAVGARGRAHALGELCADAPAAALPRRCAVTGERPVVVLEAPLLETSSAAELTIDTARALLARDQVELWLRPRAPFRHELGWLRARAPELLPRLCREVRGADLWLSAGWPVRADRPDCGTFAVRFDYEYGALPVELMPLLDQEADQVVVHSAPVFRLLMAAGRSDERLTLLPHGVDPVFQGEGAVLPEVAAFAPGLPKVLFVGGLIWRKGVDLLLQAALQAWAAGARFALVFKALGSDQHYAGFGLGELVRRVQRTDGAPPVLLLERDLSRAELAALYRSCDLLAHPYRGEGFGLPVLEARACGLPVLVTAGGSTDDFGQGPGVVKVSAARRDLELPGCHGSLPWVLEPDAQALRAAFAGALRDLGVLRSGAAATAPAVRAAFGWDAAAAGIERLAALGMGRRRPRRVAPVGPAAVV